MARLDDGAKNIRSGGVRTSSISVRYAALNGDPAIHGILVQLPLPAQIDMKRVLEMISVRKDVDGFHLYNVGGLVTGNTIFSPCTPYGFVKLLDSEGIAIEGQNVVVVGAGSIVGKHQISWKHAERWPLLSNNVQ